MQVNQAQLGQMRDEIVAQLQPQMHQASQADRRMALQLAEQQVGAQFGDRWETEIAPKLNERLAERPNLLPQSADPDELAAALHDQAMILEGERLSALELSRAQERAAKLAAQTLDSSTARFPVDTDEKKAEWAQVKNAQTGGYGRLIGQ